MELLILSLTAFSVGFLHAVEPGHGKTAMVGVLLNSKNRWKDPISLSLGTASGHTLGVFIFANLSFYFAHSIQADYLQKILEVSISILLIIGGSVGIIIARKNTNRHQLTNKSCSCCGSKSKKSIANKLFLPGAGFLIGLIPCPTAIALAVSSVGFSNQNQVFLLSLMFGLGVALTLGLIGLFVTHSSEKLEKLVIVKRLSKIANYISPAVFLIIGLMLLSHSVLFTH
ncbi:MAG: sulfite exporter TauE/SafE family protein [Candidatus Paceibacterota bacterium]